MENVQKINVRKLAEWLAEEWFDREVVPFVDPKDMYEDALVDGHGLRVIRAISGRHAQRYWNKVDEFYDQIIEKFITNG